MSRRDKQLFQKAIALATSDWLVKLPARLGNASGTVETGTPGQFYARLAVNGQVETVNNVLGVPPTFDLHVTIASSKDQPKVWQIIEVLENYDTPAAAGEIAYHHEQHQFESGDEIAVDRRQIITLTARVYDADSFIIQVYGGLIRTGNTYIAVSNQYLDLSSYVVTVGAVLLGIEADEDGALSVHIGDNYEGIDLIQPSDIPTPEEGKVTICAVRMYETQSELSNDDILTIMPIERGGMGAQIFSAREASITSGDLIGFYSVRDGRLRSSTFSALRNAASVSARKLYALALSRIDGLSVWITSTLRDYLKAGSAAGGDLEGTYPDPTVAQLRGLGIDPSLSPAPGDSLIWDGSQWTQGSGSGFILTVEEQSGGVTVANVTTIKVTDGSLTDLTGGVVLVDTGGTGGGGGDPELDIMNLGGWA